MFPNSSFSIGSKRRHEPNNCNWHCRRWSYRSRVNSLLQTVVRQSPSATFSIHFQLKEDAIFYWQVRTYWRPMKFHGNIGQEFGITQSLDHFSERPSLLRLAGQDCPKNYDSSLYDSLPATNQCWIYEYCYVLYLETLSCSWLFLCMMLLYHLQFTRCILKFILR